MLKDGKVAGEARCGSLAECSGALGARLLRIDLTNGQRLRGVLRGCQGFWGLRLLRSITQQNGSFLCDNMGWVCAPVQVSGL